MALLFKKDTIAEAWVVAMEHLLAVAGTESNLITEITSDSDIAVVRQALDRFVLSRGNKRSATVERVADTIFPIDFYRTGPGEHARQHLYDMQRLAARVEKRFVGDSYFDRMIDWPYCLGGKQETWNQLDYRVERLRKAWQTGKRTMNVAEIGISSGFPDEDACKMTELTGDLRTQHPSKDRTPVGFPCLSHISLTLFKGRLDLTAVYRNQHFVTKAYGNFIGLARLLRFVCAEVGCSTGSLVCVSTHADAELNENGRTKISELVAECRTLLDLEENRAGMEVRSTQ